MANAESASNIPDVGFKAANVISVFVSWCFRGFPGSATTLDGIIFDVCFQQF